MIWVLQTFDFGFNPVSRQRQTACWPPSAAPWPPSSSRWAFPTGGPPRPLITGLSAKEAVVCTLSVLLGAGEGAELTLFAAAASSRRFSATSFLVFTLLYMPCVAAMAAVKRELGGWRAALSLMVQQTAVAWVMALLVYQLGRVLGLG